MKFVRKPKEIEVVPYSFGMEDGFKTFTQHIPTSYIPADAEKYPEGMRSTKYPRYLKAYEGCIDDAVNNPETKWKPYNKTNTGMRIIKPTDMIILEDGKKIFISEKKLFNEYDLVETDRVFRCRGCHTIVNLEGSFVDVEEADGLCYECHEEIRNLV